jgi:hypothetical protein
MSPTAQTDIDAVTFAAIRAGYTTATTIIAYACSAAPVVAATANGTSVSRVIDKSLQRLRKSKQITYRSQAVGWAIVEKA